MGKYSIKELERLSGIKAHTIRIWEKRYNIIEPQRTATNIRFYSDDDLKRIMNVSLLNASGIKISAIAEMTDWELADNVQQLSEPIGQATVYIDRLITSMIDLDEEIFENEVSMIEKKIGFEALIFEVIYPFLNKIGVLWQTGNITPAHEHFISNLIRQRLIVSIASLPIAPRTARRAVLFLPEAELHEIGLLLYHYLTRKEGFRTYYLGQSVPHNDLKEVCETHKPHLLITLLTSNPSPQTLNDYLEKLSQDFHTCKILAAGTLLKNTSFKYPPNLKVFENAVEFRGYLREIK